ncbi:MAG: phosphate ABC transporter ATP-binding protein [Desulfomonilaceae bacterium]
MTLAKETLDSVIVHDLFVSFYKRIVIRGLSIKIPSGKLSVIVGRSGAGKSTFLRSLNRLNEEMPGSRTQGTIRINFKDGPIDVYGDRFPLERLRRRVGMVFQTPHPLPTTIEKNLSLPLKLVLNLKSAEISHRIENSLTLAHLWEEVKDRLKEPASSLSGGQQQRLCLARALALEPEILLLDEPTASLDFKASEKIEELLKELQRNYTIVAVSHSLSQAQRIADQIFVMKEGTIVATSGSSEFERKKLVDDLLEEIF